MNPEDIVGKNALSAPPPLARAMGESAPEANTPVLEKLDRLEQMLARITGPAEGPAQPPEAIAKVLSKRMLRRERGLTNLHRRPETGIFLWRRSDELKGRRITRSTKTRDEAIAIQIAAKFELEYQRRRAGLTVFDSYAKPLAPAVEHWLRSLEVTDGVRRTTKMQMDRALELLGLRTFDDPDDIQRLERNLFALEGKRGPRKIYNRLTLRHGFQVPLRKFTKWCTRNRRYLPEDPLAQWDPIRIPATHPRRPRRAVAPAEMARALLAAETLDRFKKRPHPTAIVFLATLIVGARFGAIQALQVSHFLREHGRLDLGPGVGKKRKGEAALDPRTALELAAYVGTRTEGPLFLSPQGAGLEETKMLDRWRESFAFAVLDEVWPDDVLRTVDLMYEVTSVLLTNRVPTVGGSPLQLRASTVQSRHEHERDVRALAARVHEVVKARLVGIDLHALRKTHRTWAEAAGVHPLLIDKQIGHATAAGGAALDAARDLIVSPTGRKHYVDLRLELIEAQRSAEAVRKLLDDARAQVASEVRPSVSLATARWR